MTSEAQISAWFDRGKKDGNAYMLVVCDSWDYSDYPAYIKDAAEFPAAKARATTNMQRLMEVYDLNADKAEQLAEHRCHRPPKECP